MEMKNIGGIDFKKGLREKDPKIWLIFGAILIIIALMAKLLLIAGLVIILAVAYTWYIKQKKSRTEDKKK
jgi:fumarate reductase subunit D